MGEDESGQAAQDRFEAALSAAHTVGWSRRRTPGQAFRELAEAADALDLGAGDWDAYGRKGAVAMLEARVAELLGKPAAVFVPSGTAAQQAVLRTWCDRSGSRRVAIPDLAHQLHHESDGPRVLHGFAFEHLTTGPEVATLEHLQALPDPGGLGAVQVELPLREAGCLLPTWEQLVALSAACRELGVPLHADGARLWESQPHFGRSLAEVAELLDSVYVSFYKGLGGFAGAVVAAEQDVVEEVRRWRHRMGGTLYRLTPYAVAALAGLERELPRIPAYVAWAQRLGEALVERGLRVAPSPPQTNTFRVFGDGAVDGALAALTAVVEREGVLPCWPWGPSEVPGLLRTEVAVHAAALDHDPEVVAGWFAESLGA